MLPLLRKQDTATIINMSSLGGIASFPASGLYCSTKFALEALTISLAAEITPFNIKTILVEPGYFRTDFLGNPTAGKFMGTRMGAYEGTVAHEWLELTKTHHGKQPGDPRVAAERIWEAVCGRGLFEGREGLWKGNFMRLPLGTDAGKTLREVGEEYLRDADEMEDVWRSTDFEAGE